MTIPPVVSIGTPADPTLVPVAEGQRASVGALIARYADHVIRDAARAAGRDLGATSRDRLSPDYLPVMVNAMLELGRLNGQDIGFVRNYVAPALHDLADRGITAADRAALAAGGQVAPSGATTPETPVASVWASQADLDEYQKYEDDYWIGWVPASGIDGPMTFSQWQEAVAARKPKATLAGPVSRYEAYFDLETGDEVAVSRPYKNLSPSEALAQLRDEAFDNPHHGHADDWDHHGDACDFGFRTDAAQQRPHRERGHRYDHD